MPDPENRWMPPSPHREKILEEIASGAAHIVERGHGLPPHLVFEDGGAIELPRVRLQQTRRGMQLTAAEEPASRGETRFYDVCGTVDEILGQVGDGRRLDPGEMSVLVGDIGYMLERMALRVAQYESFFDGIRESLEVLSSLQRPAYASAGDRLEALNSALAAQGIKGLPEAEAVTDRAEFVRALAQASEDYLADCRRAAMRIGALFHEIRGGRNWATENDAVAQQNVRTVAPDAVTELTEKGQATRDRPDTGTNR